MSWSSYYTSFFVHFFILDEKNTFTPFSVRIANFALNNSYIGHAPFTALLRAILLSKIPENLRNSIPSDASFVEIAYRYLFPFNIPENLLYQEKEVYYNLENFYRIFLFLKSNYSDDYCKRISYPFIYKNNLIPTIMGLKEEVNPQGLTETENTKKFFSLQKKENLLLWENLLKDNNLILDDNILGKEMEIPLSTFPFSEGLKKKLIGIKKKRNYEGDEIYDMEKTPSDNELFWKTDQLLDCFSNLSDDLNSLNDNWKIRALPKSILEIFLLVIEEISLYKEGKIESFSFEEEVKKVERRFFKKEEEELRRHKKSDKEANKRKEEKGEKERVFSDYKETVIENYKYYFNPKYKEIYEEDYKERNIGTLQYPEYLEEFLEGLKRIKKEIEEAK